MYKPRNYPKSSIRSIKTTEGEPIERKVEKMINNGEPMTEGSKLIYTERKDGVKPEYNIRTDRWEVATQAMSEVEKSITAKREQRAKDKEENTKKGDETKIEKSEKKDVGGAKPVQGTETKQD